MSVAQADAFIGCWHTKYEYNVLRPITYIRRHIDPSWEPFIVTPPFPEYTSGHSMQSSAAATVLTSLLGDVAFDDSTNLAIGHPVRRFQSFVAASNEAAISRLYGGIHYPMAIENGQEQGPLHRTPCDRAITHPSPRDEAGPPGVRGGREPPRRLHEGRVGRPVA